MNTLRIALSVGLLCLTTSAAAQLQRDSLSVHPAAPQRDGPWLILLQDYWPTGCGGTVDTRVSADSIEIIARQSQADFCTAVVLPFQQLINPQDLAGRDFRFDPSVTVNYRYDDGQGTQLRDSTQFSFGADDNRPVQVQTGSWVAAGLESSGLFIDQQGEVLTAALLDYDTDGRASWYYSAGKVDGSVYVADMQSYAEIVCVTEPCSRAAPNHGGRINMLLRDENEVLVSFDGVLQSTRVAHQAVYAYQRLDFQRSPELADICCGTPPPDLVGIWVGGVEGNAQRPDDFRSLVIKYAGIDLSSGLERHHFDVYPADLSAGIDPSLALFGISCGDERPVDGPISCSLQDYRYGELSCEASFGYAAVGVERVRVAAVCTGGDMPFESRFHLFRLD